MRRLLTSVGCLAISMALLVSCDSEPSGPQVEAVGLEPLTCSRNVLFAIDPHSFVRDPRKDCFLLTIDVTGGTLYTVASCDAVALAEDGDAIQPLISEYAGTYNIDERVPLRHAIALPKIDDRRFDAWEANCWNALPKGGWYGE
jgi:hypothetical protein